MIPLRKCLIALGASALVVMGVITVVHFLPPSSPHPQLPPMGWNTWNNIACDTSRLNETTIHNVADMILSTGLADKGYKYINLDDCWTVKSNTPRRRDPPEPLEADPKRFPHGMKSLGKYLHDRGLKFGIYADCGTYTCEGYPGSQGFEKLDSKSFADWGVDLLKLDGCNARISEMSKFYTLWSEELRKTGRDIIFSCSWPAYDPRNPEEFPYEELGRICTMWRLYNDISPSWKSLRRIMDFWRVHQDRLASITAPGNFNDPDMLEIGNGLTAAEGRTQMSIWSILAAPLLLGNNMLEWKKQRDVLDIVGNELVIAINQDEGVQQGRWMTGNEKREVWMRVLGKKPLHLPTSKSVLRTRGYKHNKSSKPPSDPSTASSIPPPPPPNSLSFSGACACPVHHAGVAVAVVNLSSVASVLSFTFKEIFDLDNVCCWSLDLWEKEATWTLFAHQVKSAVKIPPHGTFVVKLLQRPEKGPRKETPMSFKET